MPIRPIISRTSGTHDNQAISTSVNRPSPTGRSEEIHMDVSVSSNLIYEPRGIVGQDIIMGNDTAVSSTGVSIMRVESVERMSEADSGTTPPSNPERA